MVALTKLREALAGKKVYILVGLAAVIALAQFLLGVNLGISELPTATTLPDLAGQLWNLGLIAAGRGTLGSLITALDKAKQ